MAQLRVTGQSSTATHYVDACARSPGRDFQLFGAWRYPSVDHSLESLPMKSCSPSMLHTTDIIDAYPTPRPSACKSCRRYVNDAAEPELVSRWHRRERVRNGIVIFYGGVR